MPYMYRFSPKTMNLTQYDECIARLETAGAGAPEGRLYHVAYGNNPHQVQILDIWDWKESFEEFGKTLGPILKAMGVDPGQPEIEEVHKYIVGAEQS